MFEHLAELFKLYGESFLLLGNPYNIALLILGTLIGITFGCMPGLTSTMSLAIFTPFTFGMSAQSAFFFLIAIFAGAVFGGAISAILVNIPGTPSAIATGLDGYPLAKMGHAGSAISIATLSSGFGSLFGLLILIIFSPLIAQYALKFNAWEYTVLAIMGITMIAYISSVSIIKGFIGGAFGLMVAAIGQDPLLAIPRFTFGINELISGFDSIVLLISMYGLGEIFYETLKSKDVGDLMMIDKFHLKIKESFLRLKTLWKVILRGSVIGTIVGAIPACGPLNASLISYSVNKQLSKNPEEFGKGSYEGLAAAESSNNSCVGGALIPMLTLGIPGDTMTAVLIGALMLHGLTPGPLLFVRNPEVVSSIFIGLGVASLFIIVFGLLGAPFFARLLKIPKRYLYPILALMCIVGSFAIRNSLFDVFIAIVFGLISLVLRKVEIQPHPFIIAFVLGPMFEDNLRRALILGDGSFLPFITRPFSLVLLLITLVLFVLGLKRGRVVN